MSCKFFIDPKNVIDPLKKKKKNESDAIDSYEIFARNTAMIISPIKLWFLD